MDLTKNQEQFVQDAEEQEHGIDYDYSGRNMYGRTCPAIRVRGMGELNTSAKIEWDQMGKGFVIYAST